MMTKSASSISDMFHEIGERNVAAARDHHNGLARDVDGAGEAAPRARRRPTAPAPASCARRRSSWPSAQPRRTVRPRTPAVLTAAKGATPGRRAISPSQIDGATSGMVSIPPWRDRIAHAVETFRLDAEDRGLRREIVEGERHAADQATTADRAEHNVGFGLVQRVGPAPPAPRRPGRRRSPDRRTDAAARALLGRDLRGLAEATSSRGRSP